MLLQWQMLYPLVDQCYPIFFDECRVDKFYTLSFGSTKW